MAVNTFASRGSPRDKPLLKSVKDYVDWISLWAWLGISFWSDGRLRWEEPPDLWVPSFCKVEAGTGKKKQKAS